MQGIVKFYNKDKGYGFISSEESEKDFFFCINDW
ncbi:cold shock domain-containing protein, partial [Francisella tularensis subsp. holarctica]